MLTVTKTSDGNMPQSFALPASISGTMFVREPRFSRQSGDNLG